MLKGSLRTHKAFLPQYLLACVFYSHLLLISYKASTRLLFHSHVSATIMPFPFVYVCDLLEQLAQLITHHPPLLPKVLDNSTAEAALKWLREYRHLLDAATTDDDAVMRMFQPGQLTPILIPCFLPLERGHGSRPQRGQNNEGALNASEVSPRAPIGILL